MQFVPICTAKYLANRACMASLTFQDYRHKILLGGLFAASVTIRVSENAALTTIGSNKLKFVPAIPIKRVIAPLAQCLS